MKKVFFPLLTLVLISMQGCAKRQPSESESRCRLTFQAVDTSESTIYLACQDQGKLSEKPAQLKDLPKKVTKNISYFLARIADQDIPLIIENSKKLKLYMDTDCDGCLSDEKGFKAKAIKKGWFGPLDYYRFGPISINFKRDDRKITKNLYVITRGTSINPICLCPAEYRKGKIRLGQNLYEVAVIDGNFDGLYGSVFSPPIDNFFRPGCDSFFIDKNWNGRPDFSLYQRSELMPLTKMVKLGNDYYDIDVNPKGTTLELKKVIPELGTLDLGGAKVKLKLCSDAAEQFLLPHEKEYRIPAGRYTVSYMDLDEKDDQGDIWTAICYRDTGQLRDFEIRSDQNTSFKIGSPFQVMVSAKQVTNAFSINFYLEGRSGEHYNPDIRKNGRRVSPAIIKIVDEAGEVIETGRFEYG